MKVFRSFRLDSLNLCLWRGEQRVPITPKAFNVLSYLVDHAGRLVTQEEMLDALWPDTYVNQEVIKKYILGIRKVLGDSHDKPAFIETFPRRGYQFVAEVIEERDAALSALPSSAPRSKLVGRETALTELENYLDKAWRGERQVVFVTGEVGIGKTTLVDAFHQRAVARKKIRIARGQCIEGFGGKEAYYPMLEALGQLARDVEGTAFSRTLATQAPTWFAQLPSLVEADQREGLQREILGATRDRMIREICEAMESLTANDPVILVFEDLHWVDLSTLDLISALARRRQTARLMLLCTYRPVDVALAQSPLKHMKQDLQVHGLCQEVALERLEESEIEQYLATEFSGTLPPALAGVIHRHSGGNALFMVALVQDMVKKGLIIKTKEGVILAAPLLKNDPGVPETLQHILEAQIDQLSPRERSILESASVAGERFSVWSITTTLELVSDQIEDACEGLAERHQFIRSTGIEELSNGSLSAHYEFRHSLYRQVFYQRLSDIKRSRLHRHVGERIQSLCTTRNREQELASELALHFEFGRQYEHAVRYLILAAHNAVARFAYRHAIEVLQHALTLIPRITSHGGVELEIEILEFIGDAQYARGAMAESAKAYEAGASRAANAGLKSAQVNALTSLVRPFGLIEPDRGIAAIGEAVHVCESLNDPLLLARTEMLAAAVRLIYDTWRKEDADLCASAYQTIRRLGESGDPSYHKMIYGHVRALQGKYEEAFEIFDAGIPNQRDASTFMANFFATSGKTVALLRLGRFGDVLSIVRAGKQLAQKNEDDPWLFNFREAWLRTLAFDFDGARRLCEFIMRPDSQYPTGQPKTIALVATGYAHLDRENYDAALECFRQVIDPQLTPKFFLHWFWRMIAQLGSSNAWLSCGNLAKARQEADVFLDCALSTADPYLHALAWELKSRIAIAGLDWSHAQACIQNGLAILKEFVVPVAAWQIHARARDLYLHAADEETAQTHRALAESHILTIANSFSSGEPLREIFLTADPVRRILADTRSNRDEQSKRVKAAALKRKSGG
jgi:DNA-binding winged helix-turn-helix (wHTH) protein/tetratricopeptide (TPR) repeat protein